MSAQLLRMEGISKSFPGVKALSKVRLDLNYGEVLALVGENGAGKSTLMKILSGVYQKDEGEIYLEGNKVEIPNAKAAQEMGISIIHQELNLMPDLTVAQNIFIGREPRTGFNFFLKEKELNEKTAELLEKLNINLNPKETVSDLTVAKQQMVEIVKALSYNAKIIVMDEPTAALTESEIKTLFDLIENLKNKGVGIIYISHRMEELKVISDRITVMRDGQYIDTLYTKDTDMKKVISLMVGRHIQDESRPTTTVSKEAETVLEVKNLSTKNFLENISFTLKKGEILGFAGLMGAGRTEVARAIFGADKIDEGQIFINGKEVKINKPEDAVKHGIAYLSEDRKRYGLMLEMDVNSNILISSLSNYVNWLTFVNDSKGYVTSEEYVKSLKIKTPSIKQLAKNLSGGNQQKIVIAKWLAKNCDILIFDEPTRGIDVGAKTEIYQLLNELAQQGKSIIMISSELPEILRMSHRIIVMCEGRITGELTNEEASQEKIMDYATRTRS
ncbi:sugar ABC transporter ATP-binding protein [Bacillaceae bacterium ZC4]|jgi:ABC-type sugar transport system, ATPase component|uniref:D-xylose ABC transporter ATP-binding protein n=2 Tax=Aeribacillus TaxID=1055323 RepID=A0A165WMP7_9BACI|nr:MULTISPECIES: sugar ABC transporter ATP-binding protein [Aeribacillus]AXI39058.1 sugar ABC transporter ATP-binding protein [Bacillaceae bacterium ZC4]KZN95119.1 D-xylose ABC transporter ATP-binding protein [Aeribacillus pallidus]MED0716633.1 sugar ABC transporter ATP-binding protein [Aeribacillus composti]MED0745221.1 sugar ABC transporter ATP-binding protein [Aeribacillus composti]TVZ79914.1 monosaccharide ABC transporter ATP-binding protein (CUT2 family) [Aeribacillus composti]